ncbi:unnamed protein product [Cochlearia groenlandica]
MSEEEEPPLTEEEQQLVNDMCKRLDEMLLQSKRFTAIQCNLIGTFKNMDSMASKLCSYDSISSIRDHGYTSSSTISTMKPVPLSLFSDPPDLNGSEIYQEAEFVVKSIASVETHESVEEHESHEAIELVMKSDFVPQYQVPISLLEPNHRVCDKSRDVFEDSPYVLEKNNQVQSQFDFQWVDSKDNAYQMFDKMPLRKKRMQQRRKSSLSPKAWKFKYKRVNVLQVLPQRIIKNLHEECSVFYLGAWFRSKFYGYEYKKLMSLLVNHGSKVQSKFLLISSCANQVWEPGGKMDLRDALENESRLVVLHQINVSQSQSNLE